MAARYLRAISFSGKIFDLSIFCFTASIWAIQFVNFGVSVNLGVYTSLVYHIRAIFPPQITPLAPTLCAERVGFEPTSLLRDNGFRNHRNKPNYPTSPSVLIPFLKISFSLLKDNLFRASLSAIQTASSISSSHCFSIFVSLSSVDFIK